MTIVTGNPLWLPNCPDASIARHNALSASWLRCPVERTSPLTFSPDGSPSTARVLVVGVAHARRGPRGEHRLHRGAGLGIEAAPDIAQPVGALLVDGQIAPPRPVPVESWPS